MEEKEKAVKTKHVVEDVKEEKEKKGMKVTGENKDGREDGRGRGISERKEKLGDRRK